jgi:integrase
VSLQRRNDRPRQPWRARVGTPDGGELSKSFARKTDAVAWIRDQQVDQRRGEWVDPRAGDILLSDWLREVEAQKIDVDKSTLSTRDSLIRTHIDPTLGGWPINRISAEILQRWVTGLAEQRSPATVRKTYTIISEALRLAAARGKIMRSPVLAIRLPKIPAPNHRYLTEHEVHELADVIDPRLRPLVMLGAYAGLRPGESLGLRWNRVDLAAKTLRIDATLRRDGTLGQPKTDASRRTVSMPAVLAGELLRHRDLFPSVGFVMFGESGQPFSLTTIRHRGWEKAVRSSVGEPMRIHDLRHTHVALLIAAGAHAKVIADRLGHSSIRTTMDTYGGLLDGVGKDLIERLGAEQSGPNPAQARPSTLK